MVRSWRYAMRLGHDRNINWCKSRYTPAVLDFQRVRLIALILMHSQMYDKCQRWRADF
jgi:hypothetical protein